MWGGDSWEDSLAVHEAVFTNSIMMGSIAIPTNYLLMDQLAELLEINDTLQFPLNNPIAIKAHPLAIVTTRPKDKSNEVSRPVDPTTLIMRSAPLEVDFKANALNADYYEWELFKGSESILRRSEAQHKYTFEQPDTYRATLKMSNSHNCECQTEDFDISVPISDIKVPNVFTPNGDGMNDEFRVVYSSIKEFHCWVYNRWGHLVYEWSDPAKGWDGSIHGKPAAEGAYYYVIRALGTDAKTDYMMKAKYSKKTKKGEKPVGVYQLSGHINLLR
jgi:gliding motility-associated-like protein